MDTPEHRRLEAPRRSAHAGRTVYLADEPQATPTPEAAAAEVAAPIAVEIEAAAAGGEGDEESI